MDNEEISDVENKSLLNNQDKLDNYFLYLFLKESKMFHDDNLKSKNVFFNEETIDKAFEEIKIIYNELEILKNQQNFNVDIFVSKLFELSIISKKTIMLLDELSENKRYL